MHGKLAEAWPVGRCRTNCLGGMCILQSLESNFCSGNNTKTTWKRPELVRPGQASEKKRTNVCAHCGAVVYVNLLQCIAG